MVFVKNLNGCVVCSGREVELGRWEIEKEVDLFSEEFRTEAFLLEGVVCGYEDCGVRDFEGDVSRSGVAMNGEDGSGEVFVGKRKGIRGESGEVGFEESASSLWEERRFD